MTVLRTLLALAGVIAFVGSAGARELPEGSRYVALGSSYAAGPGVGEPVPEAPPRCGRGSLSYSREVARRLKLDLLDASCSGATTANLLGPWNELAPQIEAVTSDARLVTITVGGNDVRFVGNLFAALCATSGAPAMPNCPVYKAPTRAEWTRLAAAMTRIGREVHRRAPEALVVFVDYPEVVPPEGTCAALGVDDKAAAVARGTAQWLARITAQAARRSGSLLLEASALSRGHGACAAEPWMWGAAPPPGGVAMHTTAAGHAAIAEALARLVEEAR